MITRVVKLKNDMQTNITSNNIEADAIFVLSFSIIMSLIYLATLVYRSGCLTNPCSTTVAQGFVVFLVSIITNIIIVGISIMIARIFDRSGAAYEKMAITRVTISVVVVSGFYISFSNWFNDVSGLFILKTIATALISSLIAHVASRKLR